MNSGKTLKVFRILRGLTQTKMGDLLGISQQAYSKMEGHDWIDNKRMDEILEMLKCTKEELESIKKITSNKKQ
jgi:DNA-binding XRE family transcriptional regulator